MNSVFSQSVIDEKMEKLSAEICNCISSPASKLHPQIILLIKNYNQEGEEKAQARLGSWMEKASPEEQKAFAESLTYMQTSFADSVNKCTSQIEKKYPELDNEDEQVLMQKMIKLLESKSSCAFMADFLKIGLRNKEEIPER